MMNQSSFVHNHLGLIVFIINFLVQNLVPESDRMIVGGVQNSLQSFMDLLAYVMGIIISDPKVSLKTKTVLVQSKYVSFLCSCCLHVYK
jgi:solute carrier family 40 (iron-regulated transporter), member 1